MCLSEAKVRGVIIKNSKLLVISIVITLSSIFFDKFKDYSNFKHGLGLPFKFLEYYDYNIPKNNLKLLSLDNITKINFRVDMFLFSVLAIFVILKYFIKLYYKKEKR
ncbi:hypothetical protein V518_0304 [Thermoanaerobacterium aotearoense SCUT27]|uniref:Uncharacterized protein n=2 Tax=Thermoanaerobacterium TaxID=28895 RepID=W9EE69_9THEO|nr:hypothetical protein Tsac_0097 [Thermoanaerobacterium saccharolyticum JW/SL-YS485]ETO39531.1 hypothetical protein V518_0304 [Thermoanaerobacterium aotearoense SCUT27]